MQRRSYSVKQLSANFQATQRSKASSRGSKMSGEFTRKLQHWNSSCNYTGLQDHLFELRLDASASYISCFHFLAKVSRYVDTCDGVFTSKLYVKLFLSTADAVSL